MSPRYRAFLWALSCWAFVATFALSIVVMPDEWLLHILFFCAAGASGLHAIETERFGYLWGEE